MTTHEPRVLLGRARLRGIAPLARRPPLVRALGRRRDHRRRPRRQARGHGAGPARSRLVDRLAARRPSARDRHATLMRQEPDGSMVRHADLTAHRRARLERDRRGRPRQHLRQQHRLRLHGRRSSPSRASSRWSRPDGSVRQVADGIEFPNGMVVTPDNSTLIISESFAGRLTAFDIADDGSAVEPARVGRRHRSRRHLPRRRGLHLDALGATRGRTPDVTATRRRSDPGPRRRRDPGTDPARPGHLRLHARRARSQERLHVRGRTGATSATSTS